METGEGVGRAAAALAAIGVGERTGSARVDACKSTGPVLVAMAPWSIFPPIGVTPLPPTGEGMAVGAGAAGIEASSPSSEASAEGEVLLASFSAILPSLLEASTPAASTDPSYSPSNDSCPAEDLVEGEEEGAPMTTAVTSSFSASSPPSVVFIEEEASSSSSSSQTSSFIFDEPSLAKELASGSGGGAEC